MFRASLAFARDNGGNITKKFVQHVIEARGTFDNTIVVDSRVHMLMRGWYPCIPGWHHDDVPRSGANNQPEYDENVRAYRSKHIMMALDASDKPTLAMPQLLRGKVAVPWPLDDQAVTYAVWDAHINHTECGALTAGSGQIIRFDCDTFHRGMPAQQSGWRFFIRATWSTQQKAENKIRRNANVYVPWSTSGW